MKSFFGVMLNALIATAIGVMCGWILWHNDISYQRMADIRDHAYMWGYQDCRAGELPTFPMGGEK